MHRHSKHRPHRYFFPCPALAIVGISVLSPISLQPATAQEATRTDRKAPAKVTLPLASATARTIQCMVQTSEGKSGEPDLKPDGTYRLTLDAPAAGSHLQLRADYLTTLGADRKPLPKPVAVTLVGSDDPSATYGSVEYNQTTDEFYRLKGTTSGELTRGQHWAHWSANLVNMLLGRTELPPEMLTRSKNEIDGHPMDVWQFEMPNKVTGKPLLQIVYDVDASTSLLTRFSLFLFDEDGGKYEAQRLDFSGWKLNETIAPSRFALAIPKTAKEIMPPAPRPAPPPPLAAGAVAPDFTATAPDGHSVKLSDYKGKIVILDLWATWCGPCQRSMPHLEKVYQAVQGQDVAVLGVCVWDKKPAFDEWTTKNIGSKYTFPVAFDPAGSGPGGIGGKFGVSGIPTQFVIGKDGKIAATLVGYGGDGDERLEDALKKEGVTVEADDAPK